MLANLISIARCRRSLSSSFPIENNILRNVHQNSKTSDAMSSSPGPVEKAIHEALTEGLKPTHLEVINESYMHGVPKGSESHFKVLVVSEKFENTPLIKRHRMVNDLVTKKLEGDFVHALSIVAKTPAQYDPSYKVEPSPNCRGGFGK